MTAIETELLTRRGPSTFNDSDGSVVADISAFADVVRQDFQGKYIERLPKDPSKWEFGNSVPLLKDHRREVDSVIGKASNIRFEAGRIVATLGIDPSEATIREKVRNGTLKNTSIGYSVPAWKEYIENGNRVREAERVIIHEVSLVPLGADPGATTRNQPLPKELSMNQEQIRALGVAVGVSSTFTDSILQRSDMDDARARAAIIEEAARSLPTITNRQPAIVTPVTEPEALTRAAADAMYLRFNPKAQLSDLARQFAGNRLADVARAMLRERGLQTTGSDAEVVTRSLNTTSDFANLLSNLSNKMLMSAYQVAPGGIKAVCKQSTAPDFKPLNRLRRGEMPKLEKVNEKGEFKRGSTVEDKQAYSIDTFGKVFGITRKALVNDDLGAFGDVIGSWGIAASEFENGFLVDKLTENSGGGPTLADTVNLFHASRGNLAASGAVISDTTLSAGRLALRLMKGIAGVQPINVAARYLVVPAALETTAEKQLAALYPAQASNANPFTGKLELIVDPRLDAKSATRWYLFADPAIIPVIEYAYLQGFEGVQIETRNGFDIDGVEVKARLDFGAGGVDFRGAYANPGA